MQHEKICAELQRNAAQPWADAATLHQRVQRHPHFRKAHQVDRLFHGRCHHQKHQCRRDHCGLSLHAAGVDLAGGHQRGRRAGVRRRGRRVHQRQPQRASCHAGRAPGSLRRGRQRADAERGHRGDQVRGGYPGHRDGRVRPVGHQGPHRGGDGYLQCFRRGGDREHRPPHPRAVPARSHHRHRRADGGEHFRDHPRGCERHHHHAADHRRASARFRGKRDR